MLRCLSVLFLYLFQKPKHLLQKKCPVEAAKSDHLHLHRVEIRLQTIRSQRCCLQNWGFFFIHPVRYFWRTKCKYERCFLCQNKSVGQKLAQSCKKWKSAQKPIYALFAQSLSISFVARRCTFSTCFSKPMECGYHSWVA